VPARLHRRPLRPGFSLVELFAVVAVLGTLVSLMLPAVQNVRESSRRSQCVNRLKNMGDALANHESVRGAFPPGCDMLPRTYHAWSSFILPFLEEGGLAGSIDYSKPWDDPAGNVDAAYVTVPGYVCPNGMVSYPGKQDYFGIAGFGLGAEIDAVNAARPVSEWIHSGILHMTDADHPRGVRAATVLDGLAHTLLVAEAADRGFDAGPTADRAETSHYGRWATISSFLLNTRVINKARGEAFFSNHPAGLNALFADGHVTFITENVAPTTLVAISTKAGGERDAGDL
jgi:prepilin-type processing-associated H-X9-DG protein